MSLLKHTFYSIFFIAFGTQVMSGQNVNVLASKLARQYPAFVEKSVWAKDYYGVLDNIHRIDMHISTNGKEYRGIINYQSTNTNFWLEGELQSDKSVRLAEIDSLNRITGSIVGTFGTVGIQNTGYEGFTGEWVGVDDIQTYKIVFTKQRLDFPCYGMNTRYFYTGMDDPSISITVHNDNSETTALLVSDDQNILMQLSPVSVTKYTAETDGMDAELTLDISSKSPYIEWIQEGERQSERLKLLRTNEAYCKDYTTYYSKIGLTYPATNDTDFESWFKSTTQDRWDELIKESKFEENTTGQFGTRDRFKYQGNITAVTDKISERLISGIITIQRSTIDSVVSIPYHYDVKRKKPVSLDDIAKKKTCLSCELASIAKVIITSSDKKKLNPDLDFKLFTIGVKGIVARTVWHPIYGQNKVVIPFDIVEDYVNQRALKKLIKS